MVSMKKSQRSAYFLAYDNISHLLAYKIGMSIDLMYTHILELHVTLDSLVCSHTQVTYPKYDEISSRL
jgi:hypothetical protein